jgi:Xaa-Pro aminopeptidase
LLTDGRYLERAEQTVSHDWRVADIEAGLAVVLHNILLKHRVQRLGIEPHALLVSFYERLQRLLGIRILGTDRFIEQARMRKTVAELRALRQSQKINEQTLKLGLRALKIGMTEREFGWQIQLRARELGAEDMAFETIVAFGAHTARPHHESTHKKKLRRGGLVLVDMGVRHEGMASDMTRTFFTKAPTTQQAHVYETVLAAQANATRAAKPGITCDAVDKAARRLISHAGYSKKFCHATGHGIGRDVHELPFVSRGSDTILQSGMVITIEPGIYLAGKLGVRIEDMVEMTDKGNQVMTKYPKTLKECFLPLK